MGSTDILAADLSSLPLISKKQVQANPNFTIHEGWTLITRSGTIGRMAYARADMDGIACSEHVMRVVPDDSKVKPGFIYAYLSGRFGLPMVVSGTYGSIIQSIEPHHIADLPVPRLGEVEDRAHELIQTAAELRSESSKVIAEAITTLESGAGLEPLLTQGKAMGFDVSAVSSSDLIKRLDAVFHSAFHREVVTSLGNSSIPSIRIADIAVSVVEPKRFKRIHVEDAEYGIPLFGTTALMWADPQPSYFIPKNMVGADELIVDRCTVLIPRSGQLSGLIGTAVLPYGQLVGGAVSEDAIRIHCDNEFDAAFIFIALRSEHGRRQLKARAYGSSIPHLDVSQIEQVQLPGFNGEERKRIGEMGASASKLRDQAISLESQARALVERTIEEGGH
jgi:type I restriction enzyme, S subunit